MFAAELSVSAGWFQQVFVPDGHELRKRTCELEVDGLCQRQSIELDSDRFHCRFNGSSFAHFALQLFARHIDSILCLNDAHTSSVYYSLREVNFFLASLARYRCADASFPSTFGSTPGACAGISCHGVRPTSQQSDPEDAQQKVIDAHFRSRGWSVL